MSYTVNHANGQNPIVILDGQADTSTSLTFVGRNYENYGGIISQNFLQLLENFAHTAEPSDPITGQLWFNTSNKQLNVYTGQRFKNITSAYTGTVSPLTPGVGDIWFNTSNTGSPQLQVWTGTYWYTVGSGGANGVTVETIKDTLASDHTVISFNINGTRYAILSTDPEFIPQATINGFARIYPGLNIASQSFVSTNRFVGQASDSLKLNNLYSNAYMRTGINTSTTGTLSVINNSGVYVGLYNQGRLQLVNNNFTVSNTINNAAVKITTRQNSVNYEPVTITGPDTVFAGNITVTGNTYTNIFSANAAQVNGTLTVTSDAIVTNDLITHGNANVDGYVSTTSLELYNNASVLVANISSDFDNNTRIMINANDAVIFNSIGDVTFNGTVTAQKQVYLTDVSNLFIQGGSIYQVLTTDGSGTLTWTDKTGPGGYELPAANAYALGGVQIGNGFVISSTGNLSLQTANVNVLGGVKVSSGLSISSTGNLSLQTANVNVLGGVKVGSGLGMDAQGNLNITASYVSDISKVDGNLAVYYSNGFSKIVQLI